MWVSWAILCGILSVCSVSAESVCQGHKKVFLSEFRGYISDGQTDYLSNQRCEWLISSPNATEYPFISLEFSPNTTECGYDFIIVYDGYSDNSPILAALSGDIGTSMRGQQVIAKSGKMLVQLISDKSVEHDGFNATFNIYKCYNNCSGKGLCKGNGCVCEDGWTGNDCSQHICPRNCGNRGSCRPDTKLRKCKCPKGFIGKTCELNVNSNEERNRWTVIYDYAGEHGSEGRAGHAGCYIEPYYYIFGGYDLVNPLSQLLRYNFEANEWLLLQSSMQPSKRFYHSMSAILQEDHSPHLFLFGGEMENEELSNEIWLYDTLTGAWTRHISPWHDNPPPGLCQHSATVVHDKKKVYIYIFGGRAANSASNDRLSSDMFRFDFGQRKWQKLQYDSSGVRSSKLRIAGHSMVYDVLDETMVLFGGFRMDADYKAALSDAILLYSVKFNRWSEVKAKKPLPIAYNIEPLAFHTANIVGDYMIVHGGKKDGHNGNRCFSRQTHFYNLRCHSWITKLSKSAAPSPMKLFGHTATIINDKILLVHGGYFGMMSSVLRAFHLPELNDIDFDNNCGGFYSKESCDNNFLHDCVWRGDECRNNEAQNCGSVCPLLKDCVSCTSHSSFVLNSTNGWTGETCVWCVQDASCHAANEKDTSFCGIVSTRKLGFPWWNTSETQLLRHPEQCLTNNTRPGAILAEYMDNPNFERPDNVSYLDKVNVRWNSSPKGNKVAKIAGFLRSNHVRENYMKVQLNSLNGEAKVGLSSTVSFRDQNIIVTAKSTPSRTSLSSKILSLSDYKNERYYIEIAFNHSGTKSWDGSVQAKIAFSMGMGALTNFIPLSRANLEPYQSSVAMESMPVPSCTVLNNCLACLTDASCAWCHSRSECIGRSRLANLGSWCSRTNDEVLHSLTGIILEPDSCEVCSDYISCGECTGNGHCEWDKGKNNCVRKGRLKNLISQSKECPMTCSEFHDCASCTNSQLDGTTSGCTWCVSNQICYESVKRHLPAYTFGQCAFWVKNRNDCPICTIQNDCKSCLGVYECGWCSATDNPLRGYCTKGGFLEPDVSCNPNFLGTQTNTTLGMIWSYRSCPDVDECQIDEWPIGNRLHLCHENADCLNTDGSYICKCKRGFKGDGRHCEKTCLADCVNGHCSGPPKYECKCDLGWTSSNQSNSSACDVDCGCNYLSTCKKGQGICDLCQRNSTGSNCGKCPSGYYHIEEGLGCLPCECNGHGIAVLGYCDQPTGICYCQDHTTGNRCERCEKGYYGKPINGGTCYRKCAARIKLNENQGAVGSWETDEAKIWSDLRRKMENIKLSVVHCEWTISPKEHAPIKITVEKSSSIPCYTNQLLLYEGTPDNNQLKPLGQFCGTSWKKDIVVYSTSGSVVIRYKNVFPHGYSNIYGFSASYETLPLCQNRSIYCEANQMNSKNCNQSINTNTNIQNQDFPFQQFCLCTDGCSNENLCYNKSCSCNTLSVDAECPIADYQEDAGARVRTEWESHWNVSSYPMPRIGSSLISLNNTLWMFGGVGHAGPYRDLWRYSIVDKEWRSFDKENAPHPAARYYHAAEAYPTKQEFFIYGGVVESANTSSELWRFSLASGWHLFKNTTLPSLAGHTMTLCGDKGDIFIIGGFSSNTYFNKEVIVFNAPGRNFTRREVQGNIPMIYGHSSICDNETKNIFISGGINQSYHETFELSSEIYYLNVSSMDLVLLERKDFPFLRKPAAFHPSFHLSAHMLSGMIVMQGNVVQSNLSSEIWMLHYRTLVWVKIYPIGSEVGKLVKIPLSASIASVGDKHYLFGGMLDGMLTNSITVISDVQPCSRDKITANCHESTDACNTYLLMCEKYFGAGGNESSLENDYAVQKPDCSFFRDCDSCLNKLRNKYYSLDCHWCQSGHTQSRCLPAQEACDTVLGVDRKKECGVWLESPEPLPKKEGSCVWTNHEREDKLFLEMLRTCHCSTQQLSHYTLHAPDVRECSTTCSKYTTCESCLQDDNDAIWRDCVWLERKGVCVDPLFVPLLCQQGGNCGDLSKYGAQSCPKKCESMKSCITCIQQPNCRWKNLLGTMGCYEAKTSEPFGVSSAKWYFTCPLENECAKGLDDCMSEYNEICQDLHEGYRCVCKDGYHRIVSAEPCKPVCLEGCNEGACILPGICRCKFGYTGSTCNISCPCNGHSDCDVYGYIHRCVKCHNNTVGSHCESCKSGYVGDPTRGKSCTECEEICNNKSKICVSKLWNPSGIGPLPEDVKCVNCSGNSWGDRCEKCRKGYFKSKGTCQKCRCNGHSDTCDENTGGFCKCQNYTTSSDVRCNIAQGNDDNPTDCWQKQCDKCIPSYTGNPVDGGPCYRQMTMEQRMCLNVHNPSECPSSEFGVHSVDLFQRSILEVGRTVSFAITPKFINLDITIILEVTYGELTLFLTNDMNYFHAVPNGNAFEHRSTAERSKRDLDDNNYYVTNSESMGSNHSNIEYLQIDASPTFNSFFKYEPNTALRISGIQNRFVIMIPYTACDLKKAKFYLILLNQGNNEVLLSRSDLSAIMQDTLDKHGKNGSVAQLVIRQDQPDMNLFVFFSVFFSCFLLVLGIAIVILKIKKAVNVEQAHREQNMRMQHMAKRPFASVNILLDNSLREALCNSKCIDPKGKIVPQLQSCQTDNGLESFLEQPFESTVLMSSGFNSTSPSMNKSMHEQTSRSKSDVVIAHHNQGSNASDVPLLNSTATYIENKYEEAMANSTGSQSSPMIKIANLKSKNNTGKKQRGKTSVTWGRTSAITSNRSAERTDYVDAVPSLACEVTKRNMCVATVLLQLPGPKRFPTLTCLGSTLLASQNSNSLTS